MSGLELCRDLLRKYKTLMDSEKSWLNQMTAKVKTMNNRSELDYVTVGLIRSAFVCVTKSYHWNA